MDDKKEFKGFPCIDFGESYLNLGAPNFLMQQTMLSKSLEDYLEAIYQIGRNANPVKVKDIALALNVSLPSVTEMVNKLAEKEFVKSEKYGPVELTKKGEALAREVFKRHNLLAEFFVLHGIDKKTAEKDACLAEHILSKKTVSKFKEFVEKGGCR